MTTDTKKLTREVFVKDCLNNFQKQGAAAFSDGDFEFNVLWPNRKAKKYQIIQTTSGETLVLKFVNDLSEQGFHNCMWHWLNNDGTWPDGVKFNAPAEECRSVYVAEQHAIRDARLAREEQVRRANEEHARRYSEHRAHLEDLLKAAKFKKLPVCLKLSEEAAKEDLPQRIDSWVFKGLAVHRAVVANPKHARFCITHVGSGLNLGFRFDTLYGAKTAVVRFLEVIVGGDYTNISPTEILANQSVTALARLIRNTAKTQYDSHDPYVMTEMDSIDMKVEDSE